MRRERRIALAIGFGIATVLSVILWIVAGLCTKGDPSLRVILAFVMPSVCYAVFPLVFYMITIV